MVVVTCDLKLEWYYLMVLKISNVILFPPNLIFQFFDAMIIWRTCVTMRVSTVLGLISTNLLMW